MEQSRYVAYFSLQLIWWLVVVHVDIVFEYNVSISSHLFQTKRFHWESVKVMNLKLLCITCRGCISLMHFCFKCVSVHSFCFQVLVQVLVLALCFSFNKHPVHFGYSFILNNCFYEEKISGKYFCITPLITIRSQNLNEDTSSDLLGLNLFGHY